MARLRTIGNERQTVTLDFEGNEGGGSYPYFHFKANTDTRKTIHVLMSLPEWSVFTNGVLGHTEPGVLLHGKMELRKYAGSDLSVYLHGNHYTTNEETGEEDPHPEKIILTLPEAWDFARTGDWYLEGYTQAERLAFYRHRPDPCPEV